MAPIIKGTEKPTPPAPKSIILKGSVFKEQQDIKALYKQAEEDRKKIIAEAKHQATLAKEQAMTDGANQAFAQAATLALSIFSDRAKYCQDLKNPLQRLATEIAQKILGGLLALDVTKQNALIDTGIEKIRSRRKLKIQLTHPELLAAIHKLPDFEVEAVHDLPEGFLRIVTEVGSALWNEQEAIIKIIQDLEQDT